MMADCKLTSPPSTLGKSEVLEERTKFISFTKQVYREHLKSAWYWDWLYNVLGLTITFLSATATLVAVVQKQIPAHFVVPLITGFATFVSAINGFIKPLEKRNSQMESAKKFKILMFKMIRCDSMKGFRELWCEFYDIVMEEPFLQQRYDQPNEHMMDREWPVSRDLELDVLRATCKENKFLQKEMEIKELEKKPNRHNILRIEQLLSNSGSDKDDEVGDEEEEKDGEVNDDLKENNKDETTITIPSTDL